MKKWLNLLLIFIIGILSSIIGCSYGKPPVIVNVSAVPDTIYMDQYSTLTCEAYDPEGRNLTYKWSNGESGKSIRYYPPTYGTRIVSVEVSDGGLTTTDSVTINVLYRIFFEAFLKFSGRNMPSSLYLYDTYHNLITVTSDSIGMYFYNPNPGAYYLDVCAISIDITYTLYVYINGVYQTSRNDMVGANSCLEYMITTNHKGKILRIQRRK